MNWVAVVIALFVFLVLLEVGVQIFINGRGSKVLSDGDEYTILSERVKAKAVKGDGLWTVYLDGSQCGVLKYE